MERFVKGDIVIVPFPFSDLTGSKRRPAMVIADFPSDDIILCQITSKNYGDKYSLVINQSDFLTGSLPINSFIRPNKIFTADKNIIIRKAGTLKPVKIEDVKNELKLILQLN